MANRLIGALPKVGIRPVIDGRERGVRESLEDQCMNMKQDPKQTNDKHRDHGQTTSTIFSRASIW